MPDPISLSVSAADLAKALDPEDAAALASGALDKGQVWYEFITMEDDRVRPSHRALHGTVWRSGDPNAPVPPLDYGCRCFIRYVAKPGSDAAKILPEAQAEPTTQAQAMRDFLDKEHTTKGKWAEWAKQAEALPLADRERFLAMTVAKDSGMSLGQAREVARMIMSQSQTRALRAPALAPEAMKAKADKAKAAKEAKAAQVEMETKAKLEAEAKAKAEAEAEAKAKADAEAKQSSEAWKILEALDSQAKASVASAVAAVQAAMDYLGSLAPSLAVHVSNMPMGQVKVAQEWVAKAISSAGIVSTLRADAKAAPLSALDGIASAAAAATQDANSKANSAKAAADGAVGIAKNEIQAGQAAEAEAKAKAQAEAEAKASASATSQAGGPGGKPRSVLDNQGRWLGDISPAGIEKELAKNGSQVQLSIVNKSAWANLPESHKRRVMGSIMQAAEITPLTRAGGGPLRIKLKKMAWNVNAAAQQIDAAGPFMAINIASQHFTAPPQAWREHDPDEHKLGGWSVSSRPTSAGAVTTKRDPTATVLHELGHLHQDSQKFKAMVYKYKKYDNWHTAGQFYFHKWKENEARQIAGRVSKYASTDPMELVAEVHGGWLSGERYDADVIELYRMLGGNMLKGMTP